MTIVKRAPAYFSMAAKLTPADEAPAKAAFDLAVRQLSNLVRMQLPRRQSTRQVLCDDK